MSVRVNLLPEATKARGRAQKQRTVVAAGFLVLLAGLGGTYVWASGQVKAAEQELAVEQARTTQLRGEQAELIAFSELADRRDASDALLTTALADEVSMAGVLQDVAATMPGDTQVETLTVTLQTPEEPTPSSPVASFNMTGKTLTAHAPGVERVMISLDKVVSFRDLYLNSSALDELEDRIAAFSLDGQIGPEALTGRYVEGLPEELR
jgi:Tfp pilus assembly protein PilN